MHTIIYVGGCLALYALLVAFILWLIHRQNVPASRRADAAGEPLVDLGQGASRRTWPSRIEPTKPWPAPGRPRCEAAEILREKFGGTTVGALLDRLGEGAIEGPDLLLFDAVICAARGARFRREARSSAQGFKPAPSTREDLARRGITYKD